MISFKFDQTWWRLATTGILKPIEALRQCIKKIIVTETVRNSHAIWIAIFLWKHGAHAKWIYRSEKQASPSKLYLEVKEVVFQMSKV